MIIFAKTRYRYDSYTDFWRLVELSGFPICYIDEVDFTSSNSYIVSPNNGEWTEYRDSYKSDMAAKVYNWNLERPGSGTMEDFAGSNRALVHTNRFTGILVSDRWLAWETGFKYVPMGLHEGLGTPGANLDKKYDVIHLMCPSFRRSKWFDSNWHPYEEINGMRIAPNGWGESRDENLKSSRFMLAMHQDNYPIIEPLRYTLAAAYGLPILAESSRDFYPYDECDGLARMGLSDLSADTIRSMYKYEGWYQRGLMFKGKMAVKFPFRKCVEEAIECLENQ